MYHLINRKFKKLFALLAFSLGIIGISTAEADMGKGAPSVILPKLHLIDMIEINAAQMGEMKACETQVVDYARALMLSHKAHRVEVLSQARTRDINVSPVRVTHDELKEIRKILSKKNSLESIQSCQFDIEFTKAMIDSHRFAIEVVRSSMTNEMNGGLYDFLQSTLQSLEAHQLEAEHLLAYLLGTPSEVIPLGQTQ